MEKFPRNIQITAGKDEVNTKRGNLQAGGGCCLECLEFRKTRPAYISEHPDTEFLSQLTSYFSGQNLPLYIKCIFISLVRHVFMCVSSVYVYDISSHKNKTVLL